MVNWLIILLLFSFVLLYSCSPGELSNDEAGELAFQEYKNVTQVLLTADIGNSAVERVINSLFVSQVTKEAGVWRVQIAARLASTEPVIEVLVYSKDDIIIPQDSLEELENIIGEYAQKEFGIERCTLHPLLICRDWQVTLKSVKINLQNNFGQTIVITRAIFEGNAITGLCQAQLNEELEDDDYSGVITADCEIKRVAKVNVFTTIEYSLADTPTIKRLAQGEMVSTVFYE